MKLQIMSLLTAAIVMASCSTTKTSTSSGAAYGGMPQAVRMDFERHYPDATNALSLVTMQQLFQSIGN